MIDILKNRLKQGFRTSDFPDGDPNLPERFRGRPVLRAAPPEGLRDAAAACPTRALELGASGPRLDLGRCLFCADCPAAARGALEFTRDHRLAATAREDLVVAPGGEARLAQALNVEMRRVFGRSLKLRQVSAGGCSACEAELVALGNVVFDLGRFGVQFVASPRHADALVITGPVTKNMEAALKIAWEAVPAPKLVIAVGACAISGGPFAGSPEVRDGAASCVPVDLYIPGCPPHPVTLLDGLLRLLGRLDEGGARR